MSLQVQKKKREKAVDVIVGKKNIKHIVFFFLLFCICWKRLYNRRGTIFGRLLTDGTDDIPSDNKNTGVVVNFVITAVYSISRQVAVEQTKINLTF